MGDGGDERLHHAASQAAGVGRALRPAAHETMLQRVTETARRVFAAASCSIALLEDDELRYAFASGRGAEAIVGVRMPVTQGIGGWAASSEQAIAVSDVSRDPRFARDIAERVGYVPHSMMAAPLMVHEDSIGVLSVLDPELSAAAETHGMDLLALLADQAAMIVESARVFDDFGGGLLDAVGVSSTTPQHARPSSPLAKFAADLEQLSALGDDELDAAADILAVFARYAARHQAR